MHKSEDIDVAILRDLKSDVTHTGVGVGVENHHDLTFVCLISAHAHLNNEQQLKKEKASFVRATAQCTPSLYEWLIKEQTVVFSGNVGGWRGGGGVPPSALSRDRNAHKHTTGITMWL